jgi:hypothetical protein
VRGELQGLAATNMKSNAFWCSMIICQKELPLKKTKSDSFYPPPQQVLIADSIAREAQTFQKGGEKRNPPCILHSYLETKSRLRLLFAILHVVQVL